MIRIALPNKGRLAEPTRVLLENAGLEVEPRGARALQASLGEGFRALFVRAEDIPEFVADGAADLGITGLDLVEESGRRVSTLLDLGFGRCRLVVAVREESSLHGLEGIEEEERIATSFPHLTEEFFLRHGQRIRTVPVSGAAEIAPHIGVADIIVDLVSTGSTLKTNGLREIATVLESTAVLIATPRLLYESGNSRQIDELAAALESVIRAREKRYLMANVPRTALTELRRVLPGLDGPTIVDLIDSGSTVAAHAVVDRAELYRTVADLKALGASGILVTPIERLMP